MFRDGPWCIHKTLYVVQIFKISKNKYENFHASRNKVQLCILILYFSGNKYRKIGVVSSSQN
jgi:hypothetical protein